MENHNLIQPSEWLDLMTEAYSELFTIVMEAGLSYFEYSVILTMDGSGTLPEPADHFSTVELAWLADGTLTGRRRDLREIQPQERSRRAGLTGSWPESFIFVDDVIFIYPTVPAGTLFELRYTAQPPTIVLTVGLLTFEVDVVSGDGLSFVIESVAVKALRKSGSDVSAAVQAREEARERCLESFTLRSFNQPRRRVNADQSGGEYSWLGWGGGSWDG